MCTPRAKAGPGDELVTLSAYPEGRDREMVKSDAGDVTRRVVIVSPDRIARIELLYGAPNAQPFGFQPPPEKK